MRFEFNPAFRRSLKYLHPREQAGVKEAAASLIDFYESGLKAAGLGIDHLRGDFWEVRAGLRVRLLFRRQNDLIQFLFAGNHDDIRRFLRRL